MIQDYIDLWWIAHSSYFLRLPDGSHWLVDTGATLGHGQHAIPAFAWNNLGARRLNVLHTHYHFNHVAGMPWVAKRYGKALTVYSSGVYSDAVTIPKDREYQDDADDAMAEHGATHLHVAAGDTIGDYATVLSPQPSALTGLSTDDRGRLVTGEPNDETGCTIMFRHGDFSVMMNGDLGPHDTEKGLRDMIADPDLDVTSTVFNVPHHGDWEYITNAAKDDHTIMNAVATDLALIEGWAVPGRAQDTMDYLDSLAVPWLHLGTESGDTGQRGEPVHIRGFPDGTFTVEQGLATVDDVVPFPSGIAAP